MYLPLRFAKMEEEQGLAQFFKINNMDKDLSELTGENCIALCNDPDFFTPEYDGVLKGFNTVLMMNRNISSTFFGKNDPRSEWKDVISMYGVVSEWSKNKQVYIFDRDFALDLGKTKGLKLYPEVLRRLPYDTFYIDFDGIREFAPFNGIFVNVKVFNDNNIRICGHRVTGDIYYTCTANLTKDICEYDAKGMPYYDYSKDKFKYSKNVPLSPYLQKKIGNKILANDNFPLIWMFVIQALVYLSSEKPEIQESETTKRTYKKPNIVKNKFSEVRQWEVGVRYGTAIRKDRVSRNAHNTQAESNIDDGDNIHRKHPRVHTRAAHWHLYWTGTGRKVPVMKWISQTIVGASDNSNIPVVIHNVK